MKSYVSDWKRNVRRIKAGLMRLGYPRELAAMRAKTPKYIV
jgi:hypothetical protein